MATLDHDVSATDCVLSTRRQLELMQRLQQLADRRAEAAKQAASRLTWQLAAAHDEHAAASKTLQSESAEARKQASAAWEALRQSADQQYHQAREAAEQNLESAQKQIVARHAEVTAAAEHKRDELRFQALSVYDAAKDQPKIALEAAERRIAILSQQIEGLERDGRTLMEMRRLGTAADGAEQDFSADRDPPAADSSAGDAEARLQATIADLRNGVLELQDQRAAGLFLEGGRPWAWLGPAVIVVAIPAAVVGEMSLPLRAGIAVLGGAVLWGALLAVMRPRGIRQSLAKYQQLLQLVHDARLLQRRALASARARSIADSEAHVAARDADVASADETFDAAALEITAWRDAELKRIEQEYDQQLAALARQKDEANAEAEAKYKPLLRKIDSDENAASQQNAERAADRRAEAKREHDHAWQRMADAWHAGYREVADELAAMRERCERLFPDWSTTAWSDWERPAEPPAAFRFGECVLPLKAVRNGWPEDERLQPAESEIVLPAMMTLDEQPRLTAVVQRGAKRPAVETLQLLTMRFLTAIPAGKLRMTMIDAAGLGESFAGFMHLADHDEQILGGQIWTDGKEIDRRLGLLSDHMEKVLQKYLRNEFATIHDYNARAGEVAEPYHLVVVANFPAGFSDAAAQKLARIAAAGPRCGVYVLMTVDETAPMPRELQLAEFTRDAVHLVEVDGQLTWKYPLFERLPLTVDALPSPERLNELFREVGVASREASRVEVPFHVVAPPDEQIWSHDSASLLAAPIGRAGARDLQSLTLGRGTSQHVLLSGKTGSGKSTLLHALITNLALHYPPDQLEFYLVDFKKGVEFQCYASGALPHARVVAIESEREFGVSVLERLDDELRRRGELFRKHGVQDLAGVRRVAPEEVVPRTLLVIDEFQELFVTDDKLAQDAALLLDRLVRQGRAFGIHVLLGSQTLAGAYSLARSTLGQMAVRIALQCSDADAHLILSDENTAARLLSRPGEAIYNVENGLVAGNHPFQVVWLPDDRRQQYLEQLRHRELTERQKFDPPIVFAGNDPARLEDNAALDEALQSDGQVAEPTLWLGSAVRIEPPTHIVLRRQGGNNLAMVGGDEALALGTLTAAIGALHGQQHGLNVHFSVLGGGRPESSAGCVWQHVVDALGPAAALFSPAAAGDEVLRLAEMMAQRVAAGDLHQPPHYLIIHDLAQFRDLRQRDDDFSFSFSKSADEGPPPADRRFRELLKEGPAVGIHTLLWCESFNTFSRVIDRLTLREVDFRVALPMSAADSTSLIDSPLAGRLGENRAILYRDDLGTQQKFRPYGMPNEAWLERLAHSARAPAAPRA